MKQKRTKATETTCNNSHQHRSSSAWAQHRASMSPKWQWLLWRLLETFRWNVECPWWEGLIIAQPEIFDVHGASPGSRFCDWNAATLHVDHNRRVEQTIKGIEVTEETLKRGGASMDDGTNIGVMLIIIWRPKATLATHSKLGVGANLTSRVRRIQCPIDRNKVGEHACAICLIHKERALEDHITVGMDASRRKVLKGAAIHQSGCQPLHLTTLGSGRIIPRLKADIGGEGERVVLIELEAAALFGRTIFVCHTADLQC